MVIHHIKHPPALVFAGDEEDHTNEDDDDSEPEDHADDVARNDPSSSKHCRPYQPNHLRPPSNHSLYLLSR